MKTKTLASIINPMSEAKSLQPASPDDKGIGFAQFASPKKHNGGESVDINGFAKIVSKKKHNQSANVGLAPNSQVTDQRMSKTRSLQAASLQAASPDDEGIGDKAASVAQLASLKKRRMGATVGIDGILNKKKDSQTANIGKQSNFAPNSKGIGDKVASLAQLASLKKRSGGASFGIDGVAQIVNQKKDSRSANVGKLDSFAPKNKVTKPTIEKAGYTDQVRMRRFRSHVQNVPALSEQGVPAHVQNVPALSEQGVPAHSVQHVQAKSGQDIRAHSEQGTGQRVQAHTGQSFAARSLSRPDLEIRVPSQSILHSPTQSGQRTSLSAQSTPNESLQLSAQSRQHTPEAQSHPSTLNVSSTAANDNVCWNMGSTQKDGRIRIEVIEKRLEPSFYCSTKIREIMFENLEPTGYNWKSLSQETKKFYFEEFKKHFVWRQSDAIIYKSWLSSARTKYSEFVSVARSNWEYYNRRDNRIGLNVYLSWVKFWETETFKKKSLVQKNNRRSGVDGPSRHTSGSASHRLVAARLKRQFKRDPTADEVFFEAHTRHLKKRKYPIGEAGDIGMDGEDDEDEVIWIDKKSQQKYEIFLELVELMEKSGQPVDRNALFLEAVGGPDKKNRVYGVGSSQSLFYNIKIMPCTSSFSSEEENQKLKRQLTEMNDRMKSMETQLAKIIEATSVQVERPLSPANLDGQDDAE